MLSTTLLDFFRWLFHFFRSFRNFRKLIKKWDVVWKHINDVPLAWLIHAHFCCCCLRVLCYFSWIKNLKVVSSECTILMIFSTVQCNSNNEIMLLHKTIIPDYSNQFLWSNYQHGLMALFKRWNEAEIVAIKFNFLVNFTNASHQSQIWSEVVCVFGLWF